MVDQGWVAAGDLQVGDLVRRADGREGMVQAVVVVRRPQPMYNLTVEQAHTYFVGVGRWLVHNDCFKVLKPADLGVKGKFDNFLVSLEVVDKKATLRLDYLNGKFSSNPFEILPNAKELARKYGADVLEVIVVPHNETVGKIVKQRYKTVTDERGREILEIALD